MTLKREILKLLIDCTTDLHISKTDHDIKNPLRGTVEGYFTLVSKNNYCPITTIRGQNDIPHNIPRLCDYNVVTSFLKLLLIGAYF